MAARCWFAWRPMPELAPGGRVGLRPDLARLRVFDGATGAALPERGA